MEKVAITAFVDEFDYFVDEANQMTLSGSGLDDRFTFVIFAEPSVMAKIKRRPNVIVYPYVPKDGYYKEYRYANSVEFVVSNKTILEKYDYIIRTDTDVCFSDHLNSHKFDQKFYIGNGKYKFDIPKMYELAKAFGYTAYESILEPGSTVLGPSSEVISLMTAVDSLCKDVFYYLCPKGDWRNYFHVWQKELFSGTSLLIAQEIALVSCYKPENIVLTEKFDAKSTLEDDISTVYHVHHWHVDDMYSKFKARYGEYDRLDYREDSSIASYCLNIFLKNKREVNE